MQERYGRLTVVSYWGSTQAEVRCDCGKTKTVQVAHLKAGRTRSCGCLRAEMVSARRKRHGMTESREYRAWCHVKDRCFNPNTDGFERYGGRGITMHPEWRASFEAFYGDMGPCPAGHSIDRIDLDGNYEPGNCRWVTQREQMNNMSRNVIIEHEGRRLTMAEWARELGIQPATLRRRIVIRGERPPHAFRPVL